MSAMYGGLPAQTSNVSMSEPIWMDNGRGDDFRMKSSIIGFHPATGGGNQGLQISAPQIGTYNSNTAGQIAGFDSQNRQRMVNQAASDAKMQQQNMLQAGQRQAAEMGRKFVTDPTARINAAANIAGQMTRAGNQADEETFQRQTARAQLSAGDRNFAGQMGIANADLNMQGQAANQRTALGYSQLNAQTALNQNAQAMQQQQQTLNQNNQQGGVNYYNQSRGQGSQMTPAQMNAANGRAISAMYSGALSGGPGDYGTAATNSRVDADLNNFYR